MFKGFALTVFLAGLIAMQASAEDKIAINCVGEEKIQVGDQRPTTSAYSHYVSMDLAAGLVCYDECTDIETHKIADSKSDPMKIADLSSSTMSRHILYDRHTASLTDQFELVVGPIKTKTATAAKCQPTRFHQPPPITPVG